MEPGGLGPAKAEVDALNRTAQLPSIPKAALQTICAVNGLSRGGNKADLQRRIISLVNECAQDNDLPRFLEVRKSVYSHAPVHSHSSPSLPPPPPAFPASSSPSVNMAAGLQSFQNGIAGANGHSPVFQQSFQFRTSPFYEIKCRIGDVRTCEAMAQHRHSVSISVKLQDNPALQLCLTDPKMRVMVFCAAGNTGLQEISFPHQSELKVNGGDVKANLRGLKNKPGSTRPVDITNLLRLKPPGYPNTVEFTYALTTKRYYLGVYICDSPSIDTLVKRIANSAKIPRSSVVREIAKKASDPDIVATSQNLSLKCPLSYMLLKDPCRGVKCNHIQCFDATSYLQLQEQGPQWVCPICNNPAPYEQLAVDEYVKDILVETSGSVEQVTIEPNGVWSVQSNKPEERTPPKKANFFDDDDLVISGAGFVGTSSLSAATPSRPLASSFGTPVRASSSSSSMPRSATSNKRSAEVIDLTLSDDEEPADHPAKRQNTGTNAWDTVIF